MFTKDDFKALISKASKPAQSSERTKVPRSSGSSSAKQTRSRKAVGASSKRSGKSR